MITKNTILHIVNCGCTVLIGVSLHEALCRPCGSRSKVPESTHESDRIDAGTSPLLRRPDPGTQPASEEPAWELLHPATPGLRHAETQSPPQDADSPETPDPAWGTGWPASARHEVWRQVEDEERIEGQGLPAPSGEWLDSLDFLDDPSRRAEVQAVLGRFDQAMRNLQRAFAQGTVAESDFASAWEALGATREAALLETLNPEERQVWHASIGSESEAVRQWPTGFDDATVASIASIRREFAAQLADPKLGPDERAALLESRSRRLQETLGTEAFARLQRAEDPRLEPYAELADELQLPHSWADYLFDYELYFANRERELANKGFDPDEIEPHLRSLAETVLNDLRVRLSASQFEQLLAKPQAWWLIARMEDMDR